MIRTAKLSRWFAGAAAVAAAAVMAGFTTAEPMSKAPVKAEVNEKAPDFVLTDLSGNEHRLSDYTNKGHVVVLEWFNPGCPFVQKHYRDDSGTMNKLAEKYKDKKVTWLRVNSGAPGKQGAGVETNLEHSEKWKMKTPILLDESGKVGKMYGAQRTPEMYVIDTDGVLRYWGAIDDDSGFRSIGETNYVEKAIEQVLAGETVGVMKTKAYGCAVKYGS